MTSYGAIFPPFRGEEYDIALIRATIKLSGGTAFKNLHLRHQEQMQLVRVDAYLVAAYLLIVIFANEPWCWLGFLGASYQSGILLSEVRLNLLARMAREVAS